MRILCPIGWVLLALAFLAAAAEAMSHLDPDIRGVFIPAHDVAAVLAPEMVVRAQVWISRVFGAWAWDPLVVTALVLPGWLLFGAPGALVLWQCRREGAEDAAAQVIPHGRPHDGDDAADAAGDDPHALFEALAEDARREGYVDTDEDLVSPPIHPRDAAPDPHGGSHSDLKAIAEAMRERVSPEIPHTPLDEGEVPEDAAPPYDPAPPEAEKTGSGTPEPPGRPGRDGRDGRD